MFWENFWANLTADLIVGVFLALIIKYYLDNREEVKEIKRGKADLLELIVRELHYNKKNIEDSIEELVKKNKMLSPGIKSEVWDTIISMSELKWMGDDIRILHVITNIYHIIRSIKGLEKSYTDAWLKYQETNRENIVERVKSDLLEGYQQFIDTLEESGIGLKLMNIVDGLREDTN